MTLLAPAALFGLAALTLPILLHMLRQRRVKVVQFSSLRFLRAIASRTRRVSRLENLLLLLLRCLLLALLVLAFARPVMREGPRWIPGSGVPTTAVVIIDQSMSMAYLSGNGTRLSIAKDEAKSILNHLKPGDRIAILGASDLAAPILAEPTLDHRIALDAVGAVAQTQAGTDFGPALAAARKILSAAPPGRHQIFLLTDNQEIGWKFDPATVFDAEWKHSEIELAVINPDHLPSPNAAIQGLQISPAILIPGSTAHATARVTNGSDARLADILSIGLRHERAAQQAFSAEARADADIATGFTVPGHPGNWLDGIASISPDNLTDDDRLFFALPIYDPPHALIVCGTQAGEAMTRSDFYLRRALSVAGGEIASVDVDSLDGIDLRGFGVIFLVDPGPINDRWVLKLDAFLDGGGTLVYFPGPRTTPDSTANLDFLPARPEGTHSLPPGRLATNVIDPAHPLFSGIWDAATPFPALPQKILMKWDLAKEASPLLATGDGEPLIIEGRRGPGRVIVFNASADRTWGDFPLSNAFVPILQQIKLLAADTGFGHSFQIGQSIPRPPGFPRGEPLTLIGPDQQARKIQPDDDLLLDRVEMAGIYEVRASSRITRFAVNVDPRESQLQPIPDEALARLVAHESIQTPGDLDAWLAKKTDQRPLWPSLLALATIVFLSEFLLANHLAAKRGAIESVAPGPGRNMEAIP